jgi:hypothetical protein
MKVTRRQSFRPGAALTQVLGRGGLAGPAVNESGPEGVEQAI